MAICSARCRSPAALAAALAAASATFSWTTVSAIFSLRESCTVCGKAACSHIALAQCLHHDAACAMQVGRGRRKYGRDTRAL